MVKALMVLSSHMPGDHFEGATEKGGWYLQEWAHPFDAFKKAGYDITVCSIKGGDNVANCDPESTTEKSLESDPLKAGYWADEEIRKMLSDTKPLSTYNGTDFNVVMLVGGFGVMFDFYPNADIDRVGRECYEGNGIVGAVCHGPIGLASINLSNGEPLVKGKNVAGFTDTEEDALQLFKYYPTYPGTGKTVETILVEKGGNYSKADNWQAHVVTDGRLVSGQNPNSAAGVGEAIVAAVAAL